jgi:hypothetical protein
VIQLRLFAALRPQLEYPESPVDLQVGEYSYDLVLPADFSERLVRHVTDPEGGYRRVNRYCDGPGIDAVRRKPTLLDDEGKGQPTFADCASGCEIVDVQGDMGGYVALRLALGPLAARHLYRRARARQSIDARLADYITERQRYFGECGGFELLRILYYFSIEERLEVMRHLELREPAAMFEGKGNRVRFSDVAFGKGSPKFPFARQLRAAK